MDFNVLTGITSATLHTLVIKDSNGQFQNILNLLGSGGGGGGSGVVTSAQPPLAINSGVLSINLSSYSTTSQINTLLANYVLASTYNAAIATKIDTLSVGTGMTISGSGTSRALVLDGTENRNLLNLIDSNGTVRVLETNTSGDLLFQNQALALQQNQFTQINVVAPLSISGANAVTIESLFKPTSVSAGTGIFLLKNDSAGTLDISVSGLQISNISNLQTALNGKQDSLSTGEGVYLNTNTLTSYGLRYQTTGQNVSTPNNPVREILFKDFSVSESINSNSVYQLEVALPSSQPISYITNLQTELNAKEDSLQYISEGTAGSNTYYIQTNEQATPGIFLTWSATYTNVAGSHQIVNDSNYYAVSNVANSGIVTFEMDLQANTASSLLFSVNDATGWTGSQHTTFTLTNTFTTYTTTFNAYSNGNMNIHFNFTSPGYTPATGTVNVRNIRMYSGTPASVTISTNLTVNGTITCTSVTQTSDQSVKGNIELADLDEIKHIFDNVDVKTYTRNDIVSGPRIGFIAQDFESAIDPTSQIQNIVNPIYSDGPPLLGVDYSRVVSLLWGVCKHQETRLKALEAKRTRKT